MTTVAEGVETADQMERIRAEGCTDVQGYLISKPVSATEVLKFLSADRIAY
jgi:EAL domain-containing protein (putative c-di-GMP-specific phosphodiesterase class I)